MEQIESEMAKLKSDLLVANNRIQYEIDKYEKQLQLLKNGIVLKIQKDTKIAIKDLEIIASRIKQKEGEDLYGWIAYFKEYFNN
jgi:hypothetical protein